MKIQDLLDSGYVGKSVIKIEGQGAGTVWTPSTIMPGDRKFNLQRKLELSKITGKPIWMVWKCVVGARLFMQDLVKKKSPEAVKIGSYPSYGGSVVDYYKVQFDEGFSLYCDYWPDTTGFGGVNDVFIDTKEAIFPSKKKATKEVISSRVYVLSKADTIFKYFLLPDLKYPKAMKGFLKYLEKEGKIEKGCIIWNKNIDFYTSPGIIDDGIWWFRVQSVSGAPMRNIKTLDDLDCYNTWLKDTVAPELNSTLINTSLSLPPNITRLISCPSQINVKEIDITQDDIDDYIKLTNSGSIS